MSHTAHGARRSNAAALPDSLQPERLLMLAVLEEAVGTYCKYVGARTRRAARLFREAETWCASDDTRWPYSFVNICHALGIDVAYLRSGLVRWRKRALSGSRPE